MFYIQCRHDDPGQWKVESDEHRARIGGSEAKALHTLFGNREVQYMPVLLCIVYHVCTTLLCQALGGDHW